MVENIKLPDRIARRERWNELLKFASDHPSPRWVFRGQRQRWVLKPTVGRTDKFDAARELQIFNEFRRLGSPLVDRTQMITEWDWLFLAQHHGLPTRLLDWTTNPLVAMYFACQASPNGKRNGDLIAVQISDVGRFTQVESSEGPFAIRETKFIFPTVVAPRISSQRGLFSVHSEPSKKLILRNKTQRHIILADDKQDFLESLYGLGVDSAMIMTDLDGVARNLGRRYQNDRPI